MLEGAGRYGQLNPEKWYDSEEFRQAWWVTEAIPGSFTRLNAATYWHLATNFVPPNGTVVEVGVDQGRSASMLLAALHKTIPAHVVLVDSWESVLIENKAKTEKNLARFMNDENLLVGVCHAKSEEAAVFVHPSIDLLHIDAHHYHPSIDIDCETWLPKVKPGGIACFHDVGATFPDVDEAMAKYLKDWEPLGVYDCLGVWRKPQ